MEEENNNPYNSCKICQHLHKTPEFFQKYLPENVKFDWNNYDKEYFKKKFNFKNEKIYDVLEKSSKDKIKNDERIITIKEKKTEFKFFS